MSHDLKLTTPFSSLPRVNLLYPHPTFIELLANLTSCLTQELKVQAPPQSRCKSIVPKLWIKHEDTNSALAYGGNKVRKLEYVIADALEKKATHLVTVGGVQSNSQRQVAAAGRRFGMETILTPDPKIGNPSPEDLNVYGTAGNVQIASVLGADWRPSTAADSLDARSTDGLAYEIAAFREMDRVKQEGGKPYFIPSGASLHPLGGLGFARFAFELEEQEREMGVRFDVIVMSCASGSTLGGMVAGFKLIEKQGQEDVANSPSKGSRVTRRLIGIQATSCSLSETSRVVLKSARNTTKLIGLSESDVSEKDFELVGRFNGGKYGLLNEETRDAIKMLAETEGMLTDPVYTGKAMAGLIGMVRGGEFGDVQNVLFVHTGGTPALAAYPSMR